MDKSIDPASADAFQTTPGTGETADVSPPLESEGRNHVFKSLVKADDDITGLVAYSVFKQNELDWLSDFRKAKGRDPSEAETDAYILGESTTRRLATYRHLADATLSGQGPEVAGQPRAGRNLAARQDTPSAGFGGSSVLAYIAIAVVILIGVYLAVRAGMFK